MLTLKDNKWKARYLVRDTMINNEPAFSEKNTRQSQLDQLWSLMVMNNVLSLPSQNSLKDNLIIYSVDTTDLRFGSMRKIDVTDGILYYFELRTPAKSKSFSYYCPNLYLNKFPNVQELYNAVSIIMLTQKFMGKPLKVN